MSFDTVYRNLRLLSEMGALEQFYFMEGGLKFRASCLDHHHHHLICINCEKTLTFEYCPMEQKLDLPGNFKIMQSPVRSVRRMRIVPEGIGYVVVEEERRDRSHANGRTLF